MAEYTLPAPLLIRHGHLLRWIVEISGQEQYVLAMSPSIRNQPFRSVALAAAMVLAGPCGPAAREHPLVCTLSTDSAPVPALHGRARVVLTVRDGAARPVSGVSGVLRVESGSGHLTQPQAATGADGTAAAAVASAQGGAVVVSASLEGEEGLISCGRLAVSFSEPSFPVVVPGLGRWLR